MLRDSFRGLEVLVVEDETLIAEEIKDRLTRLGAIVVDVVPSGQLAVDIATAKRPQLTLMDIRLKGPMDGIEAAQAIHTQLHLPVIFLTAHSDQETLRRAKASEPFGYILKPFHERDLQVAIEMALHRHQLERQLKESEQRYAATLVSIGDGVIATDATGKITFMNPVAEQLTQWRLADACGQGIAAVFPMVVEATHEPRPHLALEALAQRRILHLTEPTLMVNRLQESIPIDDAAAPILDEQGNVLGAVVAFRDVRARRDAERALKKVEEELRHAQRMEAIGRLAGGIAHDFNNLLTVINGFTEILLSEASPHVSNRDILSEIKKAGDRAAILTRQLLAFSRRQILQPKTLTLNSIVTDILRLLQRLLGADVLLQTDFAPELAPIEADPSQIEQVIINLAVNARDAMPTGGTLRLTLQNTILTAAKLHDRPEMKPGAYVTLAVTDTGCGMDESTQNRIFEPFFTTKEVGKGTGLGLATVYGIVKQSGGFIYVTSTLGQGTTFTLYFPAVNEHIAPLATADEPIADLPGTETILLVEDDPGVCVLIATALRQQGYTVLEAHDADEAQHLFALHGTTVRLLLAGVVMPQTNGQELYESLGANNPSLQALFLSGHSDESLFRRGVLRPEWCFLQKPFSMQTLVQRVRTVLDQPATG